MHHKWLITIATPGWFIATLVCKMWGCMIHCVGKTAGRIVAKQMIESGCDSFWCVFTCFASRSASLSSWSEPDSSSLLLAPRRLCFTTSSATWGQNEIEIGGHPGLLTNELMSWWLVCYFVTGSPRPHLLVGSVFLPPPTILHPLPRGWHSISGCCDCIGPS